jgi:aminopeptidase N
VSHQVRAEPRVHAGGIELGGGKLGPYPWSSLGILVVDSNSGMETQTMITLGNTAYTTARDTIVHEIVHQWYGDEVTPDDWRDLWMSEGMAMYLQFVWQSETTGTSLEQLLTQARRSSVSRGRSTVRRRRTTRGPSGRSRCTTARR